MVKFKKLFSFKIFCSATATFLLVVSILLFHQNQAIKKKLTSEQHESFIYQLKFEQFSSKIDSIKLVQQKTEGMYFPLQKLENINPYNKNSRNKKLKNTSIVVLFKDSGCGACIEVLLKTIDKFYNTYNQKYEIIGIAETADPSNLWKKTRNKISFPIFLNDKSNLLLSNFSNYSFILLAIDKDNIIFDSLFSPLDVTITKEFLEKINRIY